MGLKWRFSGGILFSIVLHVFLLSAMIYWYPGIISKNDWLWDEGTPFFTNGTSFSEVSGLTTQEYGSKVPKGNLIFPDIVLPGQSKIVPLTTKIKAKIPQISFRSILTQVGKFPGRLKKSEISKKPLSEQVGKILTLLTPVTLQNFPEKKSLNLNPVELKGYHQQLKGFLSERWEVPIHLKESQLTAVIQLEITKNGRLLSWSIEESENSVLNKTVKKLLKNLRFLPSLPESYPEDTYKFGVRFTPANFQL
jgi:hypothetical protein